jgi:plastocyanin
MRKFYTAIILLCCFGPVKAAVFNINIVGFSYDPPVITVNAGDVVNIQAGASHPLVQVSEATWNANGNTQLPGGFSSTSNFQLTITAGMAGTTIYFVCANHVLSGMKGRIIVNLAAGIRENSVREFNFTVYPNPVTENSLLNISTKKAGKLTITLYDLYGRAVAHFVDMNMQPGETTIPFKAHNLLKGNYLLQMRTVSGTLHKQIIVQ